MQLFVDAASFAAVRHRDQKRKGASEEPYINHLLEVSHLLTLVGVNDPEVLAAAVLHDSVEDVGVSFDEISERFGKRVADIVREVTDDKGLPRVERKRLEVERAPSASAAAQAIKVADKLSNIKGIMLSPPAGWSYERKLDYCMFAQRLVAQCDKAPAELVQRFADVHQQVLRALDMAR